MFTSSFENMSGVFWRKSNFGWQIPYNNGVTWPDILVGVVATLFLCAGLLPPYFELWKRGGRVIGFSEYPSGLHDF
jgi:hypothetical protein